MYIKRVKSRRYSKREQRYITTTYEYRAERINGRTIYTNIGKNVVKETRSRKRNLSKLIVGKNGIYKDRAKELYEMAGDDFSLKSEMQAVINAAVRKGEKLSTKTLMSKVSHNKIERAFINAGYTEELIKDALGVDTEDLFNPDNWEGSYFSHKGKTYKFNWSYTGNVLIEV
jgi:hypothetical protein